METNNILHHIKAQLYNNPLTYNPDDFIARVWSERTLNTAQICASAAARGGADVSAASMQHAVGLFFGEMAYQLCDGYSVNTGYFSASANIHGVFNSPNEHFDPQKHSILFEFHQGAQLRKELQEVKVDILGVADSGLLIAQVMDVKTTSVNDLLTPNRDLKIAGYKLKIAGESEDNGVYFVNQSTQARTKVDASDIVLNDPSQLIVVIPELPLGEYRLEVTTQFSANKRQYLNEPRTTVFDKILTVQ
jgi:hypothetical protein